MKPADPRFEQRVRDSFARQAFMATLGARLVQVAPGQASIELPVRDALTQQHGFVHAGAVAAVADSACGYAAFTLMPAEAGVLTVEYKINLMSPARGERLLARARVLRAGRTLSVCQADVVAITGEHEHPVALLTATIMTLLDQTGVRG